MAMRQLLLREKSTLWRFPTGAAVTGLLCLTFLALASPASAAYQQLPSPNGIFGGSAEPVQEGKFSEEVQLGGVGGLAVNRTGAGGVPAGTVYAVVQASSSNDKPRVAMFEPKAGGGLEFVEGWEVSSEGAYERCGPLLGTKEVGGKTVAEHPCSPHPSQGFGRLGIDIDQSTGYVYVYGDFFARRFNSGKVEVIPGTNQIVTYKADGSEVITRFGEQAQEPQVETLAESPEKVHNTYSADALAVNAAGEVYVHDEQRIFGIYHRLMVFRPHNGNYEDYEYAGEVAAGPDDDRRPQAPVFDDAGNLYVSGTTNGTTAIEALPEEAPGPYPNPQQPPLCSYRYPKGGVVAMTVDPKTGELFFFSQRSPIRVRRLGPCDHVTGKFAEEAAPEAIALSPEPQSIYGLAFDPDRQAEASRPPGMLYAASPAPNEGEGSSEHSALGYIFAHSQELPPKVEAESFSHVGTTGALAEATINPEGFATRYAFQYETEEQYEVNEPDERQSLTVSATGGVFGLGFKGERLGGQANANVTSGSTKLTSLGTTTATADLKAASGIGTIHGAKGTGTTISGSSTITTASASQGSFEAGQGISGPGIPAGTTIVSVAPEGALTTLEVKISAPATASAAHAAIASGTNKVDTLTTSEGEFEVGQAIEGKGISKGTTIASVGAGELTLSKPAEEPNAAVALKAGSTTLTSLTPGIRSFEAGQAIEGEGIPAGTTVVAVSASTLTISKPPTKPGSAVLLRYPGPDPLAVGEQVEGAGIPADTTIVALKAGEVTLSNPATASGAAVPLRAGLPFDVSASALKSALQALPSIGSGNLSVSGGPGDETGSNPYEITFEGKLSNEDVPEIETDDSNLSGGPATAETQTEHQGGNGFSGAQEAPLGGAPLGEGSAPISATTSLSGLEPDTAYRLRAVATTHCSDDLQRVCEDTGSPLAFRTHAVEPPALPDHRAYELVSPADKNGGQVFPADPSVGTCNALGSLCKPGNISTTESAKQSAPDGEAIVYQGTPFFAGEGNVKTNQYIARRNPKTGWQSTNLSPTQGANSAFGATLTLAVLGPELGLSPEAPLGYQDLYLQSSDDPADLTALLGEAQFFSRSSGQFQIRYAGASEDLSRIFFEANDALTEATPFAPEAIDGGANKFNLYEWHEGQVSLVNVLPDGTTKPGASFSVANAHAVSKDGTRVFFSTESGQAYLRENGETTKEITTGGTPDPGKFRAAATNGSAVLLANGHLHSTEGSEETIDLTQGKGGFEGLVGQSEDLSHVYFIDTEMLDETPNTQGEEAEKGKLNLYAWSQGEGTRFVGRLVAEDGTGDWASLPGERTAEASPNGRWLAFLSKATLTGYDNTGPVCHLNNPPPHSPGPCQEAFLYDSATGKLVCASCNPSGERPLGRSFLTVLGGATAGGASLTRPQSRYLTDEGRLFFDSRDSIVLADTNNGVEDVYEYEPNGAGTCEREAGCVRLISAGTGVVDSNFLAMDESGENVFFTTRDQLTLKDKDQLIDLYDAREGGGIASETETARTECQGEACQAAVSPPNDPTPGSSTFEGAGNVKEGKAKKHVKKHKKKHAKKKKHTHKRAAKHNRGGAK